MAAGHATRVRIITTLGRVGRRALGVAPLTAARWLTRWADRLETRGAYSRAEPLFACALRIRELVLGAEHPDVATSLNHLAALYNTRAEYARAEPLHVRALHIRERVLGPDHRDVATSLNNLAMLYENRGDLAAAKPLYERALRITENAFGPDHAEVATSLNNLAALYQALGDHARAEPLFERALRICEKSLGPDHPDVAGSLNNLATLYQMRGRSSQAEPLYVRALAICDKALGREHPDTAVPLSNLATLYKEQGAYARAQPLYERALRITEHALGAAHPSVASMLNSLAGVLNDQGMYADAEPLFQRALRIRERVLGPNHPDVANSLVSLGVLWQAQGKYREAEPLHVRALHIRETALGADHVDVANALGGLAELYAEQGDYARSEPLHERALRIREQELGSGHPAVANSLTHLAAIRRAQGAHDEAELLYERALQLREHALGLDHPDVAVSLSHLAGLYYDQGAFDRAEPLYERAASILFLALGADHPDVASALGNLALTLEALGDHDRAEALHARARQIREHKLGVDHPEVANSLNNLAGLYQERGAYAQAKPLYQRALDILERTRGPEHPSTAALLNNMAGMFWRAGDLPAALECFTQATAAHERHISRTLAALPEVGKRQFLDTVRRTTEVLVSFHAHYIDSADALALTLTATLHRKGRIIDEVSRAQATLRDNLPPALQHDLDTLQARRAELATRRQAGYAHHEVAIRSLAGEIDALERRLNRHGAAIVARDDSTIMTDVQAALPADATLIEFVRYRRFDVELRGQEWQEPHYVAYILRRDAPPAWVALGDAETIDRAITVTLAALTRPQEDARELLRSLDELVFAPVRRKLGPNEHVLVCPDAALHLVPFAALIDQDGHHLAERLRITYLTSGRDLLRPAAHRRERSRPLVVAAPDYAGRCEPLPGAAAEAQAVQQFFADTELLVGPHATKHALKAVHGPRFVHIATHGFFRRSQPSAPRGATRVGFGLREIEVAPILLPSADGDYDLEDALDWAGLILAGTTDAEVTLTAREIIGIDLAGTQLVVLSACDTGIGQVAQSEGVYGLRRAITIAGAEAQVVSLWKVHDIATSQLMTSYYRRLHDGEGRSEALRRAQLDLLRDGQHAHPYYWAAFVPIGDERPL